MKFRLPIAMVVALTLTAMGCSSDSDDAADDPAAVVADYLEVFNAEDAEAVMVFYAEDAVIEGHPDESSDGLATSTSEILAIETAMNRHQGSTGTMEFINMEVSGDTVTFDNIFHNGDGDCFSSTGDKVTVADDKITLFVFGDLDADLC
jgi:ketosteroid isomerase-like protein